MPKSFTPRLKKILRAAAGHVHRQGRGDHEIWYSPISNSAFPIGGKIISRHIVNAALPKQF